MEASERNVMMIMSQKLTQSHSHILLAMLYTTLAILHVYTLSFLVLPVAVQNCILTKKTKCRPLKKATISKHE